MDCPNPDGSSPKIQQFTSAPPECIDVNKRYSATFTTNKGEFVVALDPIKAPKTVNNFVFLARYHYYDEVIFHRIIPGFVIQGGDPTGTGSGGPGYRFEDELPKANQYQIGSLAMANAGPNTNGSQFFVITGESGVSLPPLYTLFGQVIKGMEVVLSIEAVGTGSGKPKERIVIESVVIAEAE
ncbi:peptidyl-prolyl cis-trans isomerase B [Acidithrix ferrooxidans]|uniref:Peptidyl-prolyl cis-trans isomerase n=2 Tax=Acidimicrobiaceae TaxID=84994 RepID=A0A0D8HFX3_9ACTN|nr:peptidyl-prolyl cis-trans isomerase B [Acidithrix ferrooxidans]